MKIIAALKYIDNGWIRKPKGYRVKYQKQEDGKTVTCYSPTMDESLLDSDVTAWRLAWKLGISAEANTSEEAGGEVFNVFVVDDQDQPVKYYANGKMEVYNPKDDI